MCKYTLKNGARPLSRSRTNVRQAINERNSISRLRDPVHLSRASIVLTDPLLFRMAAIHSLPYTRFRVCSSRPNQEPKATSLLHHVSQNWLSTNTIIMPSSSCIEGKPFCRALIFHAIFELRSHLLSACVLSSALNSSH